ncbi:DUF2786 domain-containing protein [Vibrio coralliirubri]|uniref:DUF2786 domain-containing protein n=1 Tax=Vibrio coralliirubri TaxID=1516159 RepID=UPI0022853AB7|nr:DUF2786 domain-containing protein [Vibrio coralliirubri]MCY9861461.1 DUF2786 domain-containing protein [Vibrio coralliirubri]
MKMTEKQYAKIRKCLELSQSQNPHEAATALRQAQGLMRKYGLTEKDIAFINLGKTTSQRVIPKVIPVHLTQLICKVGEMYRCSPMQVNKAGGSRVMFVGDTYMSGLAAYTYDVFSLKIEEAREVFIETLDERTSQSQISVLADAFCIGWIIEVCSKVETSPLSEQEDEFLLNFTKETTDNVSGDEADVDPCDYSVSAYYAMIEGLNKGKDVVLQTPISGSETEKLKEHNLW